MRIRMKIISCFQAPGRNGQCLPSCLCSVCLVGLGAECCSSCSYVIAEIRIKFSFLKETVCVYFKSQLFGRKPNCLNHGISRKAGKMPNGGKCSFYWCWEADLKICVTCGCHHCRSCLPQHRAELPCVRQHCRKSYKTDQMSYLSTRHGNFSVGF